MVRFNAHLAWLMWETISRRSQSQNPKIIILKGQGTLRKKGTRILKYVLESALKKDDLEKELVS